MGSGFKDRPSAAKKRQKPSKIRFMITLSRIIKSDAGGEVKGAISVRLFHDRLKEEVRVCSGVSRALPTGELNEIGRYKVVASRKRRHKLAAS
jgi:hypothetical protein